MQQLQTHIKWFRSFRDLRISAFLAFLLFIFIVANAALFLITQQSDNAQAQTVPVAEVTKAVVEDKSGEVTEAAVTPVTTATPAPQPAPTQPAPAPAPAPTYDKVSIPSLGLSSRFVTVGLTSANAIDVHPSLVGWWNGSAQPGSPGAVFLDGHNPGVFSKLPNAAEGMQITLAKASGETFNYTIVHIETVQLVGINMRQALSTYGGASEGLNLMTCVGTYNPSTGTTDQRLVVYAVRS